MKNKANHVGPYDSLREYAQAMEAQGKLMQIREMDQDRFEMTAFGYRLDDRMKSKAPAFIVQRTRINDRWYETPVICNVLNSFQTVAQALGVEEISDDDGIIIKQTFSLPIDPSTHRNFLNSKIIIDATRQLPAEGGPKEFALDNRTVMEEQAGEAFELVDAKWSEYFAEER